MTPSFEWREQDGPGRQGMKPHAYILESQATGWTLCGIHQGDEQSFHLAARPANACKNCIREVEKRRPA